MTYAPDERMPSRSAAAILGDDEDWSEGVPAPSLPAGADGSLSRDMTVLAELDAQDDEAGEIDWDDELTTGPVPSEPEPDEPRVIPGAVPAGPGTPPATTDAERAERILADHSVTTVSEPAPAAETPKTAPIIQPVAPAVPEGYAHLLDGLEEEENGEAPPMTRAEETAAIAAQVKAARDAGNMPLARVLAADLKQLLAEEQNAAVLKQLIEARDSEKADLEKASGLDPFKAHRITALEREIEALKIKLSALQAELGDLKTEAKRALASNPAAVAIRKRNEDHNREYLGRARTLTPYPREFEEAAKLFAFSGASQSGGTKRTRTASAAADGKIRYKVWSNKTAARLFQWNQDASVMPDGQPIVPITPETALPLEKIWDRVEASHVLDGGPGGKYGDDLLAGTLTDRVTKFNEGKNSNSTKLENAFASAGWVLVFAPGTDGLSAPETALWYVKQKGYLATR